MKDDRDEFIPFWPQTAVSSAPYGGILGQLAEPVVEPWNDPRLGTYPETPWQPMRPLYPFLQSPGSWDPSGPALRHMPAAADTGFPAQPAEPAVPPWDDPRRVPLKALLRIGLPATFSPIPPLEHLDSGKYWPVAPAPSGANEQPSRPASSTAPMTPPEQVASPPDDDRRGVLARTIEGFTGGAGTRPLGIPAEYLARYPLWQSLQPFAAPIDFAMRLPAGVIGGAAGAGAGLAENFGLSRAQADRLQRDLGILGQAAMVTAPARLPASMPRGGSARPVGEAAPRPAIAGDVPVGTLGVPERAILYAPGEVVPGVGTGHFPRLAKVPGSDRARQIYSNDPRSLSINPATRANVFDEALGFDALPQRPAQGAFRAKDGPWEFNPAQVPRSYAELVGGPRRELTDELMRRAQLAAAARGYGDTQNLSAWHLVVPREGPADRVPHAWETSVNIPFDRKLTVAEAKEMVKIGEKYGFVASDRGQGVSLINKSFIGEQGLSAEALDKLLGVRPSLEPGPLKLELMGALRGKELPQQVDIIAGGVDYTQNFAKSNANHGMVTRMLKTYFDQVPGSVAALDANPQVRATLRAQLARDTELGTMVGGPRADVARAKQIMAESGYKGLFEALAKGEVLPSVLIPLGLAGTYEAVTSRE